MRSSQGKTSGASLPLPFLSPFSACFGNLSLLLFLFCPPPPPILVPPLRPIFLGPSTCPVPVPLASLLLLFALPCFSPSCTFLLPLCSPNACSVPHFPSCNPPLPLPACLHCILDLQSNLPKRFPLPCPSCIRTCLSSNVFLRTASGILWTSRTPASSRWCPGFRRWPKGFLGLWRRKFSSWRTLVCRLG